MARSKGRSKSSNRWLERQRKDPFVRRAAADGQTSRAYYKLAELDGRRQLLRPGMWVLELGAAPGGWTGYIEEHVTGGRVIACDPRPVQAGGETVVVPGEYGTAVVHEQIAEILGERRVDLVLSDMAPNITGIRSADQAAAMELAELSLDAADCWLKTGGNLVVKMFQGEGFDAVVGEIRKKVTKCRIVKPKASRPESREVYAVGQQFLANG